ncbi:MAG TPA: discoidin domain-containing protein [Steroidobacteraceae bacterium]|nr:discoidin domain-containing protein [Steroidobacteraceae bacterium]
MQPNTDPVSSMRKRLLPKDGPNPVAPDGEIDIASHAVVAYTSDDPDHPIENLIDGHRGRNSTFWAGAKPNTAERIVVEFDQPQNVSCVIYEVEECSCERAQEVRLEVSLDGARTYRQVLVQEYTFSPAGATFQREEQRLNLPPITHLRLTVVPDKQGSGTAKLNSLRLFSSESRRIP